MPKFLPNVVTAPPRMWQFKVPETGYHVRNEPSLQSCKANVEQHLRASGYPIPNDLAFLIEEYICSLPELQDYCEERAQSTMRISKEQKGAEQNKGHTFSGAVQCLKTLYGHLVSGQARPTQELAEARAATCVGCPNNSDVQGCSNCNKNIITQLITKIVGSKNTSKDGSLRYCSVCHCNLKAKVWVKHSAIWKHTSEEQKKQLPQETCWIISEAKESNGGV